MNISKRHIKLQWNWCKKKAKNIDIFANCVIKNSIFPLYPQKNELKPFVAMKMFRAPKFYALQIVLLWSNS